MKNSAKTDSSVPETPKRSETAAYALSCLGKNLLFGIVSSALAYYYQSVLFLPAAAIGILNAGVQAFNVLKDPAVGFLVDRTRSKYGKCRPYLRVAPVLIGFATIALFFNGNYTDAATAGARAGILIAAAAANLLWNALYSFGDVPMTTLPSVATSDPNRRAKLISYSMLAATLGVGAVSLFFIPYAQKLSEFFSKSGDKSAQYGFLAAVISFAGVATILFSLAGFFTKERVKTASVRTQSVRRTLRTISKCRPYRILFLSELLRAPADTVMTVLTMIVVYYFGNNGADPYLAYTAVFLLPFGVGQVAATLLAPAATKRFERKKLLLCSLAGASAPTIAIFFLYLSMPTALDAPAAVAAIAAFKFFAGAACGLMNATRSNMVADAVDFAEYETGNRPDATFFSGLTMLNKISVGVTSLITGIGFAAAGFSGDGVKAVNDALASGANFRTDAAFAPYRFALFFLMCVPPVVGFLVSAVPIFRYPLTNARHAEILSALRDRVDAAPAGRDTALSEAPGGGSASETTEDERPGGND